MPFFSQVPVHLSILLQQKKIYESVFYDFLLQSLSHYSLLNLHQSEYCPQQCNEIALLRLTHCLHHSNLSPHLT